MVVDLNLNWPQPRRDFATQCFAIDDVPAFHRDDLVFGNVGRRKQAAPVNLALTEFRFRREIGKRYDTNK